MDWAKLVYKDTHLIIGECCLKLKGMTNEALSPSKYSLDCIGEQFVLIGSNESTSDNNIKIGGFFEAPGEYSWVDWECSFKSFTLEWKNDVTLEEWRNGKVP